MFVLPMEIIGPVLGIGAIISFIVAGIVIVRRFPPGESGRGVEGRERQILDDLEQVKQRLGEVEERLDFTERLLLKEPTGPRSTPPPI